jgi:hypothetical protein
MAGARCTIEIKMVEVDDMGQVTDTYTSVMLTQATTDIEKLEGIVDYLLIDAYAYIESSIDESTVSALYPEEELIEV